MASPFTTVKGDEFTRLTPAGIIRCLQVQDPPQATALDSCTQAESSARDMQYFGTDSAGILYLGGRERRPSMDPSCAWSHDLRHELDRDVIRSETRVYVCRPAVCRSVRPLRLCGGQEWEQQDSYKPRSLWRSLDSIWSGILHSIGRLHFRPIGGWSRFPPGVCRNRATSRLRSCPIWNA